MRSVGSADVRRLIVSRSGPHHDMLAVCFFKNKVSFIKIKQVHYRIFGKKGIKKSQNQIFGFNANENHHVTFWCISFLGFFFPVYNFLT